jgi:hypothetical protein
VNFARLLRGDGDAAAAEKMLRSALETFDAHVAERHPQVLKAADLLASVLEDQRKWLAASAIRVDLKAIAQEVYGAAHAKAIYHRGAAGALRVKSGEAFAPGHVAARAVVRAIAALRAAPHSLTREHPWVAAFESAMCARAARAAAARTILRWARGSLHHSPRRAAVSAPPDSEEPNA